MAASGSVFAKQFAGRIRQVGKDGDKVAGGPKAAAIVTVATVKTQISAPAARAKASVAAAKSKPTAAAAALATGADDASGDEDLGGGVMTCANRGLLQQMLQNAGNSNGTGGDDQVGSDGAHDGEDTLAMSLRIVPGTPKADTQRRLSNVPTITSSAGTRPPQSLPSNTRAVSSVSELPPKIIQCVSAPPIIRKVNPAPSVGAPPGSKATVAAPVPEILTGAPQRANVAPAPARPGSSRGVPEQTMLSPTQRPITPAGRGAAGTPVGSRAGRTPVGGRPIGTPVGRAPSSYGSIHAKASPQPKAVGVMPANRIRASPFDMLRQHDAAQVAMANAQNGIAGETNDTCDDSMGAQLECNDADGFVMPASDTSSLDGDHRDRLLDLEVDQPGPSGYPQAGGSNSSFSQRPANEASRGIPEESAADYVERVKKSMGVPIAPAPGGAAVLQGLPVSAYENIASPLQPAGGPAMRDAPVAAPSARSRSSDPRAAVAAARAADSANTRSHSSDPRSVTANTATDANTAVQAGSPEDDSDDDEVAPASRGGIGNWKLDVKSMVQDFAREERARAAPPPARTGAGKAAAPARPPKAPPNAHAPESERPEERARQQAQENVPPGEMLQFSKKPREVDFVPGSLDDFKQKGYANKEIEKMGKLGPDLDDDNLLEKKAIQEKKKQFSKELQRINRQRMDVAARKDIKPEPKPEPKATARTRAQEFARNVPKPKTLPTVAPKLPAPERKVKEADNAKEAEKDQADWDEIRRREKQHHADVLRVKDIKDFLNQLP